MGRIDKQVNIFSFKIFRKIEKSVDLNMELLPLKCIFFGKYLEFFCYFMNLKQGNFKQKISQEKEDIKINQLGRYRQINPYRVTVFK